MRLDKPLGCKCILPFVEELFYPFKNKQQRKGFLFE
jgi:hypothetical protein